MGGTVGGWVEKGEGRGKGIQSGKTGANSLEGQQPLHTQKTGIQFLQVDKVKEK
jgi:hypothetical protein